MRQVEASAPLGGSLGASSSAPNLRMTRPRLPMPVRSAKELEEGKLPPVGEGGGGPSTAGSSSKGARVRRKSTPGEAGSGKRVTISAPEGADARSSTPEPAPRARAGAWRKDFRKHPTFAEGEWENELARSILVLYGSAMGSGTEVEGAEIDFAIDRDAVQLPKDKAATGA